MASLTGTPVVVTWASGATPAAQNVTIPGDCTAVYVFTGWWTSANGSTITGLTLNGANADQTIELATVNSGGEKTGGGWRVFYNPATGSRALQITFSAAPEFGPTTQVVFVLGGDTTAWRDADAAAGISDDPASVTIDTAVGDLVLKGEANLFAGTTLQSGFTSAQTQSNNSADSRTSYLTAAGTSQMCEVVDPSYGLVAAISIPASSGSVTGTGDITLESVSAAGAGSVTRKGTGAIALEALEVSGSGAVAREGTGAITLPALEVSGAGVRESKGTGDITLSALEVSGSGTVTGGSTGTGAIDLPSLEVSGAGVRGAVGSGDIALPAIEVSGSGVRQANGTGDIPLSPIEVSGTGDVSGEITGSGDITLPTLEVSGSGNREAVGTGDITLSPVEVNGTGSGGGTHIGTGDITLAGLELSGEGFGAPVPIDGEGGVNLGPYGSVRIYADGTGQMYTI